MSRIGVHMSHLLMRVKDRVRKSAWLFVAHYFVSSPIVRNRIERWIDSTDRPTSPRDPVDTTERAGCESHA